MPYDVICPQCGQSYHETTDTYAPDTFAEPHMVRLKDPYAEAGWSTFSPHAYGYGIMECPDCEAPYAPAGKLTLKEQTTAPKTRAEEGGQATGQMPTPNGGQRPPEPLMAKEPGTRVTRKRV